MTKYLILLIIFFWPLFSYTQSTQDRLKGPIIFDPTIKSEVEKNISPSAFGEDNEFIYNNRMLVDFFENDKLIVSTKEGDNRNTVFKSFYYYKGDTLVIDGAYGLFGGAGFSLKITPDKANVYHLLASDEYPSYAYKRKGDLLLRLEVPCTEAKIILSEIPNLSENQVVYGYVEFKSLDYYTSPGSVNGQEILPRKKQRANMRIHFKSIKLDL